MALPTVDGTTQRLIENGSADFVDVSHQSNGGNRLVIGAGMVTSPGVTMSCTVGVGGTAMTVGPTVTFAGSSRRLQFFSAVGVSTAAPITYRLSITGGAGPTLGLAVQSFNGVNQTTPLGAGSTGNASSTGFSISLASATDELLFGHFFGFGASAWTATGSTTKHYESLSGSWGGTFASGLNSGVGTINVQGNWDASADWGGIAMQIKPTAGLVNKFRIPTNAPNGTVRTLFVWAEQTLDTLLVPGIDVTASGGFFKYADPTATLGATFPAILSGFGANATVNASGAFAWATGIQE